MRIAVTGASGSLGQELIRAMQDDHIILPLTRSDADITDQEAMFKIITGFHAELVIHTAAIRELDFCERYPEIARSVNIVGTKNVLQAAVACSADFCLISSDAVFSGKRTTPYGENAIARPCSVYGQTKLAAERITARWPKHYIFRVSVLFGPGKLNVFETVLRTVAAGQQYTAATDQIGSATYTPDATRVIKRVVERQAYGLFHLCNPGIYSRFEFACLAASIAGLDPSKIMGKRRDEFCGEARRSEYSGMRMDRLLAFGIPLPRPVDSSLAEYIRTFVF